jgi:uncharacterized membrane protein
MWGQDPRSAVAMLTVSKFDDPSGADRALLALRSIQARQLIDLPGDAAVVSWPEGLERRGAPSPSGTQR